MGIPIPSGGGFRGDFGFLFCPADAAFDVPADGSQDKPGFVTKFGLGSGQGHPVALFDGRKRVLHVPPHLPVTPVAGFLSRAQRGVPVGFL